MKILKFNENSNKNDPKVGDYVLIDSTTEVILNFVRNNPGKIIKLNYNDNITLSSITVEYYNVPDTIRSYFRYIPDNNIQARLFYVYQILEIGSTLEELELKMQTNKFNL